MATYINVPIGPAIVEWGSSTPVVFDVTKGGIQLTIETSTQDITVDQYGDAPVKSIIKGRRVELEVPFARYDLDLLSSVVPNSEFVTDSQDPTKKKLAIKGNAGFNLMDAADKVVVKPTDPSATPNDWVTIPVAVPVFDPNLTYDQDTERLYVVRFIGYPDVENDDVVVILGDTTATAA